MEDSIKRLRILVRELFKILTIIKLTNTDIKNVTINRVSNVKPPLHLDYILLAIVTNTGGAVKKAFGFSECLVQSR